MPRACPVETHVSSYTRLNPTIQMPRACPVEYSRSLLFSYERESSTAQGRGIQFCWLVDRCSRQRENSTGQARGIFATRGFAGKISRGDFPLDRINQIRLN